MIILTVMIGCMIVLVALPTYAHSLLIEPVEPGVVKVGFGDGTSPTATAIVTVYNEAGEEIASGSLDENGLFHYGAYPQAAYLVANDRMGHIARWSVGETGTVGHHDHDHGHGHHDHGHHEHEYENYEEGYHEQEYHTHDVHEQEGLSRGAIIAITLAIFIGIAGLFYIRYRKTK